MPSYDWRSITEKSLIVDFHFCATVSASGVNEKACLPSVLASRSARFATVLFSVRQRTGSFGSSGWSFLFFAARFLARHSSSCIWYILSSAATSLIQASTTGSMSPLPEAKSPAM